MTYVAEPSKQIFDISLTIFYVPLEKISLSAVKDKDLAALKKSNPLYLFVKKPSTIKPSIKNDSFFIEMANTLALYEISRHFKVKPAQTDANGSARKENDSLLFHARWSRLARDTGGPVDSIRAFVKKTAEKYSVDLVIIPYACSLKETETQTRGWRNDKYGTYYEKPSAVNATAFFQIQIWDKFGVLQFEQKGSGQSKQPLLYDAFKQSQAANQDLVDFSKNIFAPELVRALGEACRNAFTR